MYLLDNSVEAVWCPAACGTKCVITRFTLFPREMSRIQTAVESQRAHRLKKNSNKGTKPISGRSDVKRCFMTSRIHLFVRRYCRGYRSRSWHASKDRPSTEPARHQRVVKLVGNVRGLLTVLSSGVVALATHGCRKVQQGECPCRKWTWTLAAVLNIFALASDPVCKLVML